MPGSPRRAKMRGQSKHTCCEGQGPDVSSKKQRRGVPSLCLHSPASALLVRVLAVFINELHLKAGQLLAHVVHDEVEASATAAHVDLKHGVDLPVLLAMWVEGAG